MDNDPISQLFPDEDDVDLYKVLNLTHDATAEDIKKSYRRLALKCHPDKQLPTADKTEASTKFQQVGFAYAVLSDEIRRKKYDETGRTDEGIESLAGEDGWEAYFEAIFERVTRDALDGMKKEYQGSAEEVEDLRDAYIETNGSIAEIMTRMMHSSHDDEPRFIIILSKLIDENELPSSDHWNASIKDEKARIVRKKQADKEAGEAEALARELGVWDEFYGSGKKGQRKGKAKADKQDDGEEDVSALQALILRKKQNAAGFLDQLAAKYADADDGAKSSKSKKRSKKANDAAELDEPASKRRKQAPAPDIDDEEFKKIQERMFGAQADSGGRQGVKGKNKRKTR